MTGTAAPRSEQVDEPDPMRWKALAICLIAGFMALLDVSIVNVAIPSIATGLHAGESSLQWIVSGYALTFGLALVPAGRVGDARGRRPAFMVGLALFTLSSVVCGLAPNDGTLTAARLVQGAAGGVLMPQVSGLMQQLFRGAERGKAFGLLGASIGISTAVGPLLGGLIISVFGASEGWRFVFFVNLPIGIVTLLLAMKWIPHVPATGRRESLDPVGVVLLGGAVTALLLPFIEQKEWGRPRLLLFPVAAVLLTLWLGWERSYSRRAEPVVDLTVRRAGTAGAILQTTQRIGSAAGIAFTGSVFYAAVRSSHGDWALAFRHGLWVITAFTVATLVLGASDLRGGRRRVPTEG